MRTFTKEELTTILEKHRLWLNDEGGTRANFSGANLSWADFSGANLSWADFSGANLSWTDFSGANLSGANLSWANFSGANFSGAKSSFYAGQRTDGYQFFYTEFENEWLVVAGCQKMTLAAYREYIKTYDCKFKRAETKLILDFIEKRYKLYLKKGSN